MTTTKQKVVLVSCGSFNPVIHMHLRMFELARDTLHRTGRYTVVGGIISPVGDGYKKKDLIPAKHRCNMIRRALKTSDWIRLDTWESEENDFVETAKVFEHLRLQLESQTNNCVTQPPTKRSRMTTANGDESDEGTSDSDSESEHADNQPPKLMMLCGADLLESFTTPGLWTDEDIETFAGKYGIVCTSRGGSNPQQAIYESNLLSNYQENIIFAQEWMGNEVSSTKVRRALRRGESVKYLLPDPVIDYIRENGLYGIPAV